MKKTLLILALTAMFNVANAQDITVFDFDGTTPTFTNTNSWGSDTFVSVANPVSGGDNVSTNVGMFTDNSDWNDMFTVVDIDPKLYTSFQIKVYSPYAGKLNISFKDAADVTMSSYSNTLAVTAGWTTITQNVSIFQQQIKKIVFGFSDNDDAVSPAGEPTDVVYLDDLKFIKATDITLYGENFEADLLSTDTSEQTFAPSAKAGKWIGGKDLVTDLDANMTLRGDGGGWVSHLHTLQMNASAAATPSAPVTIPNIDITGYDNLKLSFENVWLYWNTTEGTVGSDSEISPVIEIKSGIGSWIPLTTAKLTNDWTTQILTLPTVDNTLPLSIRISGSMRYKMILNDLVLTGKVAGPLGTNSNQLSDNSIKVYPNPFVNEFNVAKSEGTLQVSVFDVLGRKVATAKSASSQLSMGSSLKSGVYIVKVEGANAKDSKSFKIIKK